MSNEQEVRIAFSREGGVAGRTIAVNVDTASLPAEEASTLRRLVGDSNVFDAPLLTATSSVRDGFHVRLAVESGGRHRDISAGERSVPESMQPLIEFLTRLAKAAPRAT
jgi:hypothetical protein